ncbi:hypothetical protein KAR91_68870, partial [Candidatus Pacearchaeota archaeon]|nr:hypothetical protein [Candidatus Pacearchaeota archaeon]
YHGISRSGGTCDDCGVDVVNSDERRRRFAKIVLPMPVINPIYYDLITSIGGKDVKTAIDDLMKKEESVLYIQRDGEFEEFVVTNSDDVPDNIEETWERLEAIHELVRGITEPLAIEEIHEWKILFDNIDNLFINEIIVLPPDLRPASKSVAKNNQVVDRINRFYVQILTKKETMRDTIIDVLRDKTLFYSYFKQIQKDVNELYTHIVEKLSKKEGLIRGNILGKRIDFSGRAVIIPDPTIQIEYCVLPYIMVLELFKLKIAKKLIEFERFRTLNEGIDFIDECIEYNIPVLFQLCEELVDGEVCLLNRQPSLHRLSMLGFRVQTSLDNVIKIHPLSCPPFNADFDGDQMAVYIPISEVSKQEVIDKFLISRNYTNPANGSLSTTPSQDIILGIYMLTAGKFEELNELVECKGKEVRKCTAMFNNCLPDDYPVVLDTVNAAVLIPVLNNIKDNYPHEITSQTLDAIKKLGFKYVTMFGATMSLQGAIVPGANELQAQIFEPEDVRDQLHNVSSVENTQFLKDTFKYSYMIESGARGSWDQARQIVLTRGFISNFRGQIIPQPIKSSFLNGLNQKEFFNSTYGSRKGLLDVALNTGTSGYLSRKLIFTCANLTLDMNNRDCGSTDYLDVYVADERKAKMMVGKYYYEGGQLNLVTEGNYKTFIDQTLRVRSPIYCKTPGICCTCYGELNLLVNSRFIGVVAAQSLGETNTQLVLRTFHTSGVAVVRDSDGEGDMKQDDI